MCIDPMGMVWLKDLMVRKPKPTNTTSANSLVSTLRRSHG
jgi:hypothetical protein